jgi:predicted nucleic acid-binding protein
MPYADTNDPIVASHLGEAQAIVLALGSEYREDLILLDELAARAIAKETGLTNSGEGGQ